MTDKNLTKTKEIVGIEISHNSNGVNIFLTFIPHEYQHIHIDRDNSVEFWLNEQDCWEMVKNKITTIL